MFVVATCPECAWCTDAERELEAMIAAAARLDDHLVTEHDYSFGTATEVARKWLRGSLDELEKAQQP